jgi:type VI secretion system protein VasJ
MGSGTLSGWEERWEALPLACESSWGQMESLANKNIRDLKLFEEDLARIRPPQPEWDRYAEIGRSEPGGGGGKGVETDRILGGIGARAREAAAEASGIVPLDEVPGGDVFPLIQAWHSGLMALVKEPPSALFVGGNAQRSWMAYFRRPLEAGDFPRIWGPPAEAA